MAEYHAVVSSPRSPEEVFDFVADFSNLKLWDPSMKESEQLDKGNPLRPGARFRVVASAAGRDNELEYETVEIERPRMVKLKGHTDGLTSIDTITVAPTGDGGCEVTYDAKLELAGIRKVADPLLQLGFNRMGDKARDGLKDKLSGAGSLEGDGERDPHVSA